MASQHTAQQCIGQAYRDSNELDSMCEVSSSVAGQPHDGGGAPAQPYGSMSTTRGGVAAAAYDMRCGAGCCCVRGDALAGTPRGPPGDGATGAYPESCGAGENAGDWPGSCSTSGRPNESAMNGFRR